MGTTSGLKNLNNLAGGLASTAVSFAFTGNATFNILNLTDFGTRINGGLLELTVGKDGISSKIGNGGTNISYSTIKSSISGASSLHKNSQINKTKYDKQTKDALRSQWGFGDKTAKKQLEEIIKGETVLKFDAAGSEVAQSVTENGQKVIHINSSQNEGFIDLGLTLQHEAHRDGIISDEQGQYIETVNAVAGHTKMALAMAIDKLYTKDMLNHISSDTNLQNDINAYMYAAYTGNTGLFADYVNTAYDSSADYWKLMDDGSLAYDGKANLYDENGNLIYKTEKTGLEGSLVEILYGKNATAEQIDEVRNLMDKNFSHYTVGDDANNKDNWYWNGKVIEDNMGKQISGLTVFGKYGDSIVSQAYAHHFDSTVDGLYAFMNGIDIGTVDMKATAFFSMERFRELYKEKSFFYESAGALVDYDETKITGEYQESIYKPNGTVDERFYVNYNNLHYGIDIGKLKETSVVDGKNVLSGLNGKVESLVLDENSNGGYQIYINYGYNFEDLFISTGLYGEFDHLKNKPTLNINENVNTNTVIGQVGNTGKHSLGSHLHYTMYTKPNSAYSDSTAKILLGENYLDSAMTNIPETKTVFDPTYFFLNNRSKR